MSDAAPKSESPMTYEDLLPSHGDGLIAIRRNGQAAVAYIRRGDEIHQVPVDVTTDYDMDAEEPLTVRRFTVRAGRNAKDHKRWLAAKAECAKPVEAA